MTRPHLSATAALTALLSLATPWAARAQSIPATTAAAPTADDGLDSVLDALLARPGGLTANVVARRAVETSFDVRARRAEVSAASAGVAQSLLGYVPRLTLGARYTRLSPIDPPVLGNVVTAPQAAPGPVRQGTTLVSVPLSFPVVLDQYVAQATVAIPLSDYLQRLPALTGAARDAERAARWAAQAARARAASEGRVAYYHWVRARLQAAVASQALEQARAHLADARLAARAGTASQADVLRVESQVAHAELLAARASSQAALAEDRVRTVMHRPAHEPLEIGEDVRAEVAPLDAADDIERLLDEAASRRPEMLALAATAEGLRRQASASRAAGLPRLDAVADLTAANPNPRVFPLREEFQTTWSAGVQLTWSPNDLAMTSAGATATDARVAAVEAQSAAMRDALRAEVLAALHASREAELAVRTAGRGLEAAEASYRARRALFRNDRATGAEMTDAETELTRARLEALGARVDLRVARVRLLHAIGREGPR